MKKILGIIIVCFVTVTVFAEVDLLWEKLVKISGGSTYLTTDSSPAIGLARFAYDQDAGHNPLFVLVLANKQADSINLRKSRVFAIGEDGEPIYFELIKHRNSWLEESFIMKPMSEICLLYQTPVFETDISSIKNIYLEMHDGLRIRIVSEDIIPEKPYDPFKVIKPIDDFWKKLRDWFLIIPS